MEVVTTHCNDTSVSSHHTGKDSEANWNTHALDAFLLKKLISNFVHLVPGMFLFMLLCLVLRHWWLRVGNTLIVLSLMLLIGLSSPPLSNQLVNSLESKYPVLLTAPEDTALILVLANGQIWADERPSNTVMKSVALSRITEGIRLWKTKPDATLVTSATKITSPISTVAAMTRFATEQGVFPEQIVQFSGARDTRDEIDAVMDYMQNKLPKSPSDKALRLVVVSSAVHLARAELMLQEYEALYTMAPTDSLASSAPWYRLSSYSLESADRTLHEYVGIVWLKLQYLFNSN